MGISSTKRGIRTMAATEEYRANWERLFGQSAKEKAPAQEEPGPCPLGESCLNANYEVGSGRLCEGCGR